MLVVKLELICNKKTHFDSNVTLTCMTAGHAHAVITITDDRQSVLRVDINCRR